MLESKYGNKARIDHDRLFKELIENFFSDFIDLFFPEIYEQIDFNKVQFLKQELFTDITVGEKHYIDLLIETKLKKEDGIILIHIETQANYQSYFAERMFIYFSRLYQKYRTRIIPIAVFSYDEIKDEPSNFQMEFPFIKVLDFNYYTIELKKKNWRDYIKSNNPVAAALMSKMGYNEKEKVQIKLEFLRMITKMQLDIAKITLLTGFFETYLKLNIEEERQLEKAINQLNPKEAEKMLELTTSWHEKGREEGIMIGMEKGMEKGIEKGIEKGELKKAREMAKELIKDNMAVELIAKYTKLPKEEVEQIKSGLKD